MSVIFLQLIAAAFIWFVSIAGGFSAVRLRQHLHHHSILQIAEAFAGGIFLGAALFHMLPDAQAVLHVVYPELNYPFANLICAAGFCLLLFLEQIVAVYQRHTSTTAENLVPILMTMLISIHALSEGIALGINQQAANILLIFIAIAVHKGSEGFAVGIQLLRGKLARYQFMVLFGLFSIMSPLGVSLGVFAHYIIQGNTSELLIGICNAFAAGTFLYIATLHKLHHHHDHENIPLQEFGATLIGLTLMAAVAIWL